MLCCLFGGALVALIARSAARNPSRRRSVPAAVLLGAAAGVLSVEVFLATLVPLGLASAPGSLLVRLAVLVIAATAAAVGLAAGGGTSVLSARGSAFLGLAAGAGALVTEGLDIHVLHLNRPGGTLEAFLVHLVPVAFLCAGLLRAGRLAGIEHPACQCHGQCRCGCQGETAATGGEQDEPALLSRS
ncbi:MAG: hypothetical protein ACRD0C_04855 [Acidimicrobiia bacterium]